MIYDLSTRTPTKPLFDRVKWVTIMNRVHYRRSIMVYKYLQDMTPTYMKDVYRYVCNNNTRSTRHSGDKSKLYLAPQNNLKVFTDSFQYSSIRIWNQLPRIVRSSNTLRDFNGIYLRWFHSQE